MEGQEASEQALPSLSPSQPERQKQCRYCRLDIHKNANVCYHCRCHQWWFVQYLLSFGGLALIVALAIGGYQIYEASGEKIAASEAKRNADIAITNANMASEKAKKAQCDLIQTGFYLIDVSNTAFYHIRQYNRMSNEGTLEMFGGIDNLRKRLREEHLKSEWPPFPELYLPTKVIAIPPFPQ